MEVDSMIDNIQFRELSDGEKKSFLDFIYKTYREDMVKGKKGYSKDAVILYSEESLEEVLPEGILTPDQCFYGLFKDNQCIGRLWFAKEKDCELDVVFLYYIHIDHVYRRQGLGSLALAKLEEFSKTELNVKKVILNVFAFNKAAFDLYKKNGFYSYTTKMVKDL